MPSLAAAPSGPATRPRVAARAVSIMCRSVWAWMRCCCGNEVPIGMLGSDAGLET